MGSLKCNDKTLFASKDFLLWIVKMKIALNNVCVGDILTGNTSLRFSLLATIRNSLRTVEITATVGELETTLVDISTTIMHIESCSVSREAYPSILLLLLGTQN